MSESDYSKKGLLQHLKESARNGLLNPAIARSRKTAAEQLLSHLTEEEKENLKTLDVDKLCSRVHKLEDSSIRKEALNLYNSRLKSALTDYFSWVEEPNNFVSVASPSSNSKNKKTVRNHETKILEDMTFSINSSQDELIPIAIRDDLTIYIKNLPINLNQSEAEKISRVIKAFAKSDCDE